MYFLTSLRVATRIQLLIALTLIGLLTLCFTALLQLKACMLDDRKEKTRNLVETGIGTLKHYHQLAKDGKLSEEDAKTAAREALRSLRYGKGDYYFAWSGDGIYYLLPGKPEWEGKNKFDLKDAKGKFLVQEMIATARKGGGFVDYWFPRAGQDKPEPKLSYVASFQPWNLTLGTGIYIDDVDAEFQKNAMLFGGISLSLLVILSICGWLVGRSVLSQLGGEPTTATEVMNQVAKGDLSVRVQNAPPGSLLNSLGSMVISLRGLIVEIDQLADRVVINSKAISRGANEVAATATRETDATASMAAATEELTASSSQISDSAKETERDSLQAMELAGEGSKQVVQASSAIQQISATVADTSRRIYALEERANQVSSIANVIKEIAGQTNLLALNAAIEAARAGEQGRGFAVVADEVRKLAERTSLATTEIEQMISGIQSDTLSAVTAMNAMLPEVRQGVELAGAASSSLQVIETGAGRTLERIREVANATLEQSAASTSIAQRVDQIAQMVESTANTMRTTADTAKQLERVALGLKARISRFHI